MSEKTIPELPSADKVRERLDYDPMTGVFTWLYCDAMPGCWSARFAGKVAGSDNADGYRVINIGGRLHRAHRIAWFIVHGEWPVDDIDHINGNRADNRIANLRSVSRAENMRNKATPSNNATGHIGVSRCGQTGQFRVTIQGRHVGRYGILADAIATRKSAEERLKYHKNHGRTI